MLHLPLHLRRTCGLQLAHHPFPFLGFFLVGSVTLYLVMFVGLVGSDGFHIVFFFTFVIFGHVVIKRPKKTKDVDFESVHVS